MTIRFEIYRSRPAVQGEQYTLHRFRSGPSASVAARRTATAVLHASGEGPPSPRRSRMRRCSAPCNVGPAEAVEMIRLPRRGRTYP